MRSSLTWLALLCSVAAGSWSCSSDNGSGPSQSGTEQLQGGTGGTGAAAPPPASTAASTSAGGTSAAVAPTQPATRTPENAVPVGIDEGQKGQSGGVQVDAGAEEDAGRPATEEPDAGASAPPAAEADAGVAAVTFANVFPILVSSCGICHGANARNGLPQFAQQANQAASFAATQGMSMNDLVSNRIIQRAVFQRSMPPACRAAALGSPNCLSQANADELQAWVNQGAKQ